MKPVFLSVIIPSYNEETNIRLGALEKVSHYLNNQSYVWEVIVVDDGSTDASASLVRSYVSENPRFSIITNPHQGKAGTVIAGIKQARGDIVLFSDLDQATPLKELEKILPWFTKGFDVVIGSRAGRREGAPMFRRIMARGFMILRTLVLGLKGISDTQCGFKAFKKEAVSEIVGRLSLFSVPHVVTGPKVTAGFDIELLYIAKTLGYKIKEVPVDWHYVETRRVNPITDTVQGLSDILSIRMSAWKGKYSDPVAE